MTGTQLDDFVVPGPGPSDSVKWHVSRAHHPDMDPFWVADMDFRAPEPVLTALRSRAEAAVFGYSFVPDSLYEAYSSWSTRRYGFSPPADHLWLPGVMAGVNAAVASYSEPGEGIIIQPPVYFPFAETVERLGRTIVENTLIRTDGRYSMNLDELEKQAAAGAKVLLLCSPHNPVGRVWDEDELQASADICARYGVILVADEIHADLIVSGRRFVPAASLESPGLKLVTLVSATKSFNIPGLPGAFAYSRDRSLLDSLENGLSGCGGGIPNVMTLAGTSAAWQEGDAWLDAVLGYLKTNEDVVRDRFDHLPVTIEPLEGTYLLWIDCSRIDRNDLRLQRRLRDEARAWLIQGSKFGAAGAGYLRMNIATSRDRLYAACGRIARVLEAES
ncbi:MAG: putative C-S lyase [Spirochaetaceae bacterium]|nr:MAG: putative C-S lyase [Spirochaetaceae bacterium]